MKRKILNVYFVSIMISFSLISCYNKTIESDNLHNLGFYSSHREIAKKFKRDDISFREHYMLGLAYKKDKKYKKSIFHFVNSCFEDHPIKKIKLFADPVFRFVKEFHFKSELYDDSIYEIAKLFYLYREFKYVIKFIDLMKDERTALYRDAILLKAKAFVEIKKYDDAVSSLKQIIDEYEDNNSKSLIHMRLGSTYERKREYGNAVNDYLSVIKLDEKSWHSGISANRILEITSKSNKKLNDEEMLLLSKALFHNSKYSRAIDFLKIMAKSNFARDNFDVFIYLTRSFIRKKRSKDADRIIKSKTVGTDNYLELMKTKAEELWKMRKRHAAVDIFKKLVDTKK